MNPRTASRAQRQPPRVDRTNRSRRNALRFEGCFTIVEESGVAGRRCVGRTSS
jgi:hypothetical protein